MTGTPSAPASIRARGWGWRHAGRSRDAVAGLDLDISAGERVLLLGPSGAGKSTLLAALAGVLGGADEGDETGELGVAGAHPSMLRGVAGLMLQDPQANTILPRVGDDVAFGCENLAVPRDEIWRRVGHALEAVGLDLPLDRSTAQLSGGQRQRLALAGIIAMRPGLLLLDEPTANLDPDGVLEVRDAVARVAAETGATLVVVEHRVEAWLDVVDRVVVLEPGGGVSADGTPDRVLGSNADRLAAAGVWVPGHSIEIDRNPSPAQTLLTTEGLAVGHRPPRRRRRRDPLPEPVASGIDVTLRAGESTVVTGPNGAGKSTFALTLAGLLEPLAGRVVASGTLAAGAAAEPRRWRSTQLLTRIGTVFQQPEHQFVSATVRGELEVGPRAAGRSKQEAAAIAEKLMESLRLTGLASANPFTLSGGEQRRLSVATILATGPRVLVLDEPTFGQDRTTWREVVQLISGLVDAGSTVVSVSHDPDVVRILGDQVLQFGTRSAVLR